MKSKVLSILSILALAMTMAQASTLTTEVRIAGGCACCGESTCNCCNHANATADNCCDCDCCNGNSCAMKQ
jgi:hypothetical protein